MGVAKDTIQYPLKSQKKTQALRDVGSWVIHTLVTVSFRLISRIGTFCHGLSTKRTITDADAVCSTSMPTVSTVAPSTSASPGLDGAFVLFYEVNDIRGCPPAFVWKEVSSRWVEIHGWLALNCEIRWYVTAGAILQKQRKLGRLLSYKQRSSSFQKIKEFRSMNIPKQNKYQPEIQTWN